MSDRYRFNYNKQVIAQLKKYKANTAVEMPNVNVATLDQFSIDYPNVSATLRRFIQDVPNVNVEALGLDSGNLNLIFSSNISTNYFQANIGQPSEANANVTVYYNFLCYTSTLDRISTTVYLKNYN